MRKAYTFGRLFGIEISASRSTVLAAGLLWVALGAGAYFFFHLDWSRSVLTGLAATLLHYFGETWHQYGHAFAARRTGYPMKGIRFWGLLGASVYPKGEPELPAATHIRRALGGVPASFLLSGLAALALVYFPPANPPLRMLVQFVCWENLLVFGLGSLLPLGFTDGSTLLRYWGKR